MAFISPINDEITIADPDFEGTVRFTCPSGELDLRFSWEALAKLQARWDGPDREFDKRVISAIDQAVMEDLSVVAAAASGKAPAEIMAMGPPINPLCDALTLAWSYAWNGGEPPEEDKPKPEKSKAWLTLFGWRVRAPFERV